MPEVAPVVVINPNSSDAVTAGLRTVLDDACPSARGMFACATLRTGPPAIEAPGDIQAVVPRLLEWADDLPEIPRAVIVACFSDPGVGELRAHLPHARVLGIGEAALSVASSLTREVGVISILAGASHRHWAYYERWGVSDRVVGDRPMGLGVAELQDEKATWSRLQQVGAALRDRDGAGVIVLGCAGLSTYRRTLEAELGLPVIDPTLAAMKRTLEDLGVAGVG